MTTALLAPAKINLGLEVIRKRDDGFHDIATVFQTVSLFDRIDISPADADSVQLIDRIVQIEENLAEKALQFAHAADWTSSPHRIAIEKRIPLAAGMGGASTDAAAVLRALCPVERDSALPGIALQLGSDVPFLLHGGAALATGRGEVLERLPSLRGCWFVLATPEIEIERKTARLYGALTPDDFSDGTTSLQVARALRAGSIPAPADLTNAFSRPLRELVPAIDHLHAEFRSAGAPFVALSGAGPTHYTLVGTLPEAIEIAQSLARSSQIAKRVMIARPVPSGILLRRDKTPQAAPAL